MGDSDLFAPEVWTAQHPTRGVIKLTIATPEHLRTIDAGWPEIITDDKDKDAPKDKEEKKRRDQVQVVQSSAESSRNMRTSVVRRVEWVTKWGRVGGRAKSILERWEAAGSKGLLLECGDARIAVEGIPLSHDRGHIKGWLGDLSLHRSSVPRPNSRLASRFIA